MSKTSNFKALIQGGTPVLVDFYADWCGPCKAMAPVVQKVASEVGDAAKVLKINIDRNPALAQNLNIQAVPTFVLFQHGKEIWRRSGMQPLGALTAAIGEAAKNNS